MSYLRHPSRQILETVKTHLRTHLNTLGWFDPTTTPAGAPAIDFTAGFTLPQQRSSQFQAGMVSLTIGDTPDAIEQELGGALVVLEVPLFVDIIMGTDAHATMAADDVRDIFKAYLPNTKRTIPVLDYSTGTGVATSWRIEFEDITRARPDHDLQVHWHVVKATAMTYYNEMVH